MMDSRLFRLSVILGVTLLTELWPLGLRAEGGTTVDRALCTVPSPSSDIPSSRAKRNAQKLLGKARSAYERSDFLAAVTALRDSYAEDPSVAVLYNIAQTCREAGHDEEALSLYTRVLSGQPDETAKAESERHIAALKIRIAETSAQTAAERVQARDFGKAADLWQKAYSLHANSEYLRKLAETQLAAGQRDAALASYTKFLQVDPSNPAADTVKREIDKINAQQEDARAQKHMDAGEMGQAFAAWSAAVKLDPQPLFYFRMADAARRGSLRKEAITSYEQFLKTAPPQEMQELRQQAETYLTELRSGRTDTSTTQERLAKANEKVPVYKKWWLWTTVGAVVVIGVATGVTLAVLGRDPDRMGLPTSQPFQ